ncbi:MAG: hypothetical protein WD068_03545 [Candidatus Babeliales bacterium]
MKNIVWIVYDGIDHSVFGGQVVAPAVARCQQDPLLTITIISFEKKQPAAQLIETYAAMHPRVSIVIMRKLPFFGRLSLIPALYQLRNFLKNFKRHEITARGPLAGWLALKVCDAKKTSTIIVQARGLLAEEYWYRYAKERNPFNRLFHISRHNALESIEREVYSAHVAIEAVTCAMKEYLIKMFNAHGNCITLAQEDIPLRIAPAQVAAWKQEIRQKLSIEQHAQVYCYVGAVKAWQKPDMVIEYFQAQLKKDPQAILLLLTQDSELFTKKLIEHKVPLSHTRILSVPHHAIYQYLSAANTGMIFRDEHILSFVSRPVKAMEYQSVGLEIVHNGTVDWLNYQIPPLHEDECQADQ